jgi:hypothetical protein
MRNAVLLVVLLLAAAALLTACGDQKNEAAATVEDYLQGLVNHDSNQISNLSCSAWEMDALTEVDSFQLVKVTLEDVRCSTLAELPDGYQVRCTGAIETSYNNEQSRIDLADRTYIVQREKGDLFVCGAR